DAIRERNVTRVQTCALPIYQQTWNRRYQAYLKKIQTSSPYKIAEVLQNLNLLKFEKTLSFGERKMLDKTQRLLVQEMAVAKDAEDRTSVEEDKDDERRRDGG